MATSLRSTLRQLLRAGLASVVVVLLFWQEGLLCEGERAAEPSACFVAPAEGALLPPPTGWDQDIEVQKSDLGTSERPRLLAVLPGQLEPLLGVRSPFSSPSSPEVRLEGHRPAQWLCNRRSRAPPHQLIRLRAS